MQQIWAKISTLRAGFGPKKLKAALSLNLRVKLGEKFGASFNRNYHSHYYFTILILLTHLRIVGK